VVRVRRRLVAWGLAGVVAVGGGLVGGCASSSAPTSTGTANASPVAVQNGADDLQSNYQSVIASVMPSVVQINTSNELGSGIILDNHGDIVTNNHVVAGASDFKVTLSTSSQSYAATLIAGFPQGDLAVIKLTNPPANLRPANFADSAKAAVGQIVLAMGNPIGLSSSATNGIISATGRTVTEPQADNTPAATLTDMIQTSAPINPGNSGGALVNLEGAVVGIPTLTAVDPELGGAFPGIGFAIASNTAKDIADQIVEHGKVVNSGLASLGITGRTLVNDNGQPVGVGVVTVTPNGPAANAGIAAGDVITSLDNSPITSLAQMQAQLATLQPGNKVPVGLQKANGTKSTVEVTLGTLPVS